MFLHLVQLVLLCSWRLVEVPCVKRNALFAMHGAHRRAARAGRRRIGHSDGRDRRGDGAHRPRTARAAEGDRRGRAGDDDDRLRDRRACLKDEANDSAARERAAERERVAQERKAGHTETAGRADGEIRTRESVNCLDFGSSAAHRHHPWNSNFLAATPKQDPLSCTRDPVRSVPRQIPFPGNNHPGRCTIPGFFSSSW